MSNMQVTVTNESSHKFKLYVNQWYLIKNKNKQPYLFTGYYVTLTSRLKISK